MNLKNTPQCAAGHAAGHADIHSNMKTISYKQPNRTDYFRLFKLLATMRVPIKAGTATIPIRDGAAMTTARPIAHISIGNTTMVFNPYGGKDAGKFVGLVSL